jgi:glycosyltransferase involved in cell wall biosynthesis
VAGADATFLALVVMVWTSMRVSVIIPTRNEVLALRRVLADLPAALVSEVIVVDSNSTDGTPEIAAQMGARVVREPRRGYGRACLIPRWRL